MNAEEVESALLNASNIHSDLITLIKLPNRTWENRLCRAVRLLANNNSDRAGVLITGSMHAREWGGSDICVNFLLKLIESYVNNTTFVYGGKAFPILQLKKFLGSIDLFVFPDVIPNRKVY
jgi:carboxypeptidase T